MATKGNEISRLRHRRDVLVDRLLSLDFEKCGEKSRSKATERGLSFAWITRAILMTGQRLYFS